MAAESLKLAQLAASALKIIWKIVDKERELGGEKQEKLNNAAKFVSLAMIKTQAYLTTRANGGARDRAKEEELAVDWTTVEHALAGIDEPAVDRLVRRSGLKARYWANPEGWERNAPSDLDISLNQVNALSILIFKRHRR